MLTEASSTLADIIAEQEAIFVKRQPASAALAARAAGVLAGGVVSSWQTTTPQPVWLRCPGGPTSPSRPRTRSPSAGSWPGAGGCRSGGSPTPAPRPPWTLST